jgi:hypothetical protein
MPIAFEPDDRVRQIAEAYALDAVDYADKVFHIKLDWTDESIHKVESILDRLYQLKGRDHPSSEQVLQFAKMFGSYIGETYRRSRNHKAKWGVVTMDGERFAGMSAGGASFWPWGRVQNRLNNGDEDNVWHYYKFALPN